MKMSNKEREKADSTLRCESAFFSSYFMVTIVAPKPYSWKEASW